MSWADWFRLDRANTLAEAGILGMNARNANYVLEHNPRKFYPRVDDKVETKRICERSDVPIPRTYAIIERHGDLRALHDFIGSLAEFVVKPASGSGGRGVVVIAENQGATFCTAGGRTLDMAALRYHIASTLSGLYSLGGQRDRALIEQRVLGHPAFEKVAVDGTPDIRVIVYRGVPVMAMTRLPTKMSGGRANLHQGAVAAGINIATGWSSGGVWRNRVIAEHPDTGAAIADLCIPFWDAIIAMSIRIAEALELGYVGLDFVLDAGSGPLLLEANARPGLAIQIANRRGLLPRLRWVDRLLVEGGRGASADLASIAAL